MDQSDDNETNKCSNIYDFNDFIQNEDHNKSLKEDLNANYTLNLLNNQGISKEMIENDKTIIIEDRNFSYLKNSLLKIVLFKKDNKCGFLKIES